MTLTYQHTKILEITDTTNSVPKYKNQTPFRIQIFNLLFTIHFAHLKKFKEKMIDIF